MSSRRLAAWGLAASMALLLGSAGSARAGARHWSFLVLDVVAIGRDGHRIRLKPSPPGKSFPQTCSNFIVRAEYDLEGWSEASRRTLTREAHDRSIQLLLQAEATQSIVLLGAIGLGFGAESEGLVCEVASRALFVAVDPTGNPVILSVYEEPGSPGDDPTIH